VWLGGKQILRLWRGKKQKKILLVVFTNTGVAPKGKFKFGSLASAKGTEFQCKKRQIRKVKAFKKDYQK